MSFAVEHIRQCEVRGRLTTAGQDLSGNSVEKSDTPLLFEGNGANRALKLYRTAKFCATCVLPTSSVERDRPQAALVDSLRGFAAAAAPPVKRSESLLSL